MMTRRLRWCSSAVLLSVLIPGAHLLSAQKDDISRTRSFAESQHEIVVILVKKKEFAKAAEEANKIFQMKWPDGQEPLLLTELRNLSTYFADNGQPALAVRLLETNLEVFKARSSKASIWKEKGYLLEKMGKHDEALECFREAQRLEKVPNPLCA
jgi:tetratricopeptide (TPR) repeat protein